MQISEKQIEAGLMFEHGIAWDKGLTEFDAAAARNSMRELLEAALSAAEPQPAPSVAVKAIEAVWKYSLVIESSVRRGDGPDQYAGVTEALRLVKEARSALSAQVQDVADMPQSPWPASDWAIGRIKELEAQAVPEGWQLVPKEPTPEMIAAAKSTTSAVLTRSHATEIYRAMLAAAPAKQEG